MNFNTYMCVLLSEKSMSKLYFKGNLDFEEKNINNYFSNKNRIIYNENNESILKTFIQ